MNAAAWVDDANCRGADPELFDTDVTEDATLAKLICAGCPVAEQCLEQALLYNEVGIWAGTTPTKRKSMRRRLGIKVVRHAAPISHGTAAGARAHQRRNEAVCRDCRDAERLAGSGRQHNWRRQA